MKILDNFIIISLIFASFYAGLRTAGWYYTKATNEKKEALEKQFLRIRARMDADDPCKPYQYFQQPQVLSPQFEERLKKDGKAIEKVERSKRV